MINDNFTLQFFSFIILNLIVLASSGLISTLIFKGKFKNWNKLFLSIFLLYTTQVFLSQIALGAFGLLTYPALWALNLIILLATAAVFIKKKAHKEKIQLPKAIKIRAFSFLAIFSPFIAILLVRYFNAVYQIPLEYDNISYHLPFVVEWLRTGSLLPIHYSAYAGPLGYYPSNYELFDLWAMLPFGKDYLINLISYIQFPLLLIAIYQVCRNLKMSHTIALISAAIFFYMPQTFRQMGVPLVDLFFALTFTTAIYFLQEFWKTKSNGDILLFGISVGLFVGTKYLGVPYIAPLILAAFVIALIKFKNNKKKIIPPLLISASAAFLTGGFWYIRNWINSGNPIFPVEVKALGVEIFQGYYNITDRLLSYSLLENVKTFHEFRSFAHGFYLMTGLQAFLIAIAFIVLAGIGARSLIKAIKKKKRNKILVTSLILGLSAIFYFYFYWKSPYSHINLIPNVRYAMMFLIVGSITAGFVAQKIKQLRPLFHFLVFTIIGYNLSFMIINPDPIIILNDRLMLDYYLLLDYWKEFLLYLILIAIFIGAFHFLTASKEKLKRRLQISGTLLLTFIIGSQSLLASALPERETIRERFLEAWYKDVPTSIEVIYSIVEAAEWFNENAPEANIAYSGFNFHYHFNGRDLQREVDYVNINECLECRYVDYKDSITSIRRDPDFNNWLNNLKAKNKQYIVIAPNATEDVKSWEFEWAQKNPQHFAEVFKAEDVYIFEISY